MQRDAMDGSRDTTNDTKRKVRRRDFIKVTGASAITPLVGLKLDLDDLNVRTERDSNIKHGRSPVIEFSIAFPSEEEVMMPDRFVVPPIVSNNGVFIPDYGEQDISLNGSSPLVYTHTGLIERIRLNHWFTPPLLGPTSNFEPALDGSPVRLSVDESSLQLQVVEKTSNIGEDESEQITVSVPTENNMVSTKGESSTIETTITVRHYGERNTYGHPDKKLIPMKSRFGSQFLQAQKAAKERGISIGELISTKRVRRSVTKVPELDAVAISEHRIPNNKTTGEKTANVGGE